VGPSDASTRYHFESPEFVRVVNLSDAVFAIALTLLVLTLEVPRVPAGELAGALADQRPQMVAFALAFLLVANVWWQHHRLVATLEHLEPGMVAINIAALAGVALVPFPTNLVGIAPNEQAAVLPFIGLFVVLSVLWVCLILRAHALDLWQRPMSDEVYRWLLADWVASISVAVAAFVVAIWAPVAGLVLIAIASATAGVVMSRLGPPERKAWF
jgi:uncharacterized membrane protein